MHDTWKVDLIEQDVRVEVPVDEIAKVTVSSMGDCKVTEGVVELIDGRRFAIDGSRFVSRNLFSGGSRDDIVHAVESPIDGALVEKRVRCVEVREIRMNPGTVGAFSKGRGGRFYPPEYAYDPLTGDPLTRVGSEEVGEQ